MKARFAARMAMREIRASRRRLALYTIAVTAGVGALVAINSFRDNVIEAVSKEARNVLGADLQLRHRNDFPDSVVSVLDSVQRIGVPVSREVRFGSMVLAIGSESAPRLLQIKAVRGAYPYYGNVSSEPSNAWSDLSNGRNAVVDPTVLVYLDADVGDTIAIGEARFVITGVLTDYPGDLGVRVAVGPRVFIPLEYLDETQLLRFGSIAAHRAYLKIDDNQAINRFLSDNEELFDSARVRHSTVADVEEDLSDGLDALSRFLGLVGLVALLLGGIGIGSAVRVFVKERTDSIAVLRCLGATQATVFSIYAAEALVLGLGGSILGAALGVATQAALPLLLSDFLPFQVEFRVDWVSVGLGIGIGTWIALVFAALPLLKIRTVAPLRALRKDMSGARGKDPLRWLAMVALAASVAIVSIWQAPEPLVGAGFAVGIGLTTAVLALMAWVTTRTTRRFFPRRASYVLRQGIANLFRPQNQTVSVILGIGFGAFLLATLHLVQVNLINQIEVDTSPDRPNLAFFDIQSDQADGVLDILSSREVQPLSREPIIPSRIAALNGRPIEEVLEDTTDTITEHWMLRREYRNTYRDYRNETEEIVAGSWWEDAPASDVARISVDEDIAAGLALELGDRITWDVQGVEIESEIVSLRRINWARLQTNYFVIFEPGYLDDAPQTHIFTARIDDPLLAARVQRDIVGRFPNVSIFDLGELQETIDGVLSKVSIAVRFMALFSIASGLVVLIGAIATTRYQRVQESALLKTLGATARQIRQILLTEYFSLGAVAGLTGMILATGAGWALSYFVFEIPFDVPTGSLLAAWLAVAAITTIVGLLNSRGVTSRTPLATLRDLSD